MAQTVKAYSPASGTVVFTAHNATGQYWNGSAFATYSAGSIASYAIAATSLGGGWYSASLDDAATSYDLRLRAGGSLATTDPVVDAYAVVPLSQGSGANQILLSAGTVSTSGGGGGASGITVGANAVYAGPINNATGKVTIWRGDAPTLPWIIEDYSGDTQHGDAISLRFLLKTTYNALSPASITSALTKTATASLVSGTLTLSFPLLTTETDDLSVGANGEGSTTYRLQVINTTRNLTLIDTTATVRRRIE